MLKLDVIIKLKVIKRQINIYSSNFKINSKTGGWKLPSELTAHVQNNW